MKTVRVPSLMALFFGPLAFGLMITAAPAQVLAPKGGNVPNMDLRVTNQSAAANLAGKTSAQLKSSIRASKPAVQKALAALKLKAPGVTVTISPITGSVEVVSSSSGLTGPAPGQSGFDIVRSFLTENSALYGLSDRDLAQLHFIGESRSPGSGLRMVRVQQMVDGYPVFQSETRVTMDRDGRIFRTVGLMVRDASGSAASLAGLISAENALGSAMASVSIPLNVAQITRAPDAPAGSKIQLVANDEAVTGTVPSELVYFPIAPGVLVPAWSQVTFTNGGGDFYTMVDARSGTVLWRKNIRASASAQDARFQTYVQADGTTPADNPAPQSPDSVAPGSGTQFPEILPSIVSMHTVMALFGNVSQNGWIDDCPAGGCTANETQTVGNNVLACLDRENPNNTCDTSAAGVLDGNGRPTGNPDANGRDRDFLGTTPRDFVTGFLPPPQGGNPEAGQTASGAGNNGTLPVDQFRRGVVTHLFYVVNWYHDRMFNLGFDEAAGNFQQTNFSGMGAGNDRVNADAQDVTPPAANNANFSTPPDGTSGRAQMFRFTFPTIDRDGDLDQEVLIHELTHGTSNRLIGNASGLVWDVGGGMGEGWSDFYALSLLNNTNADNPDGRYASGAYATYKLGGLLDNYVYGIRRFPYSTDNTVNPLTWADVDDTTADQSGGIAPSPLGFEFNGGMEVHNIGEVWCLSLWEVRSRVIAAGGGDVPTGNQKMLQLVTDAMKMTPLNPSFVDARDAVVAADCATNACANEESIWAGFADRGLGYNAVAPLGQVGVIGVSSHMGVGESFNLPYLDIFDVATDVTIDDSSGNNNGAIEPGEPVRITVKLHNPWSNTAKGIASASATLTSSTAGVVIHDGASTYPAIPAQGSANGDTFFFSAPTGASCGQSLKFTITPTSSLGSHAVDFTLRVGAASGTGAPITYTRGISPDLAIPDGDPRGVVDTSNITDDFQIADVNFRLDKVTHPFTGDITAMLRGPNGYGSDLVYLRGIFTGEGDGDNFVNTVIDDEAPPANDLNLSLDAQAPFTGDWLPAFNSPIWNLFGIPGLFPDPVGQLSRHDGNTTQGIWKMLIADNGPVDTGTITAWSMIVTPTAFACGAFTPTATVSGTQTVSGTFSPGGTVTYTVTLTNNGTGNQADNPGDEFSEVLPISQLTLVSATATSGAAVATVGTNTVTWNGSIAPLGGSVTITITATIKPGTDGQTVSAQGTINYDADVNGTNEALAVTDDPGTAAPNDPTRFTVALSSLSINDVTVAEGNSASAPATFTVTLSPASGQTVTVSYATGNGSATTPFDYTAVSGTLTFAPGQTTKTISVPVNGDTRFEPNETFFVNLSNPNNATISDDQGQGTITNDDVMLAAQTINVSTRMRVDATDERAGIGGFIITGSASKHVLVRAIGPSLTKFGINNPLPDPTLEIHGPGAFGIVTNNDWRDSQEAQIKADGLPPTNDLEAAIDVTLPPGAYTAIVRGRTGTSPSGVALFEVYDLDTPATSQLRNLSTRAFVGTGGDVVIAGFVLGNNGGDDRVVVRGLGPSLASFGIANPLADPTLELRDGNGTLITSNNDWQDDPAQAGELTSAGLQPSNTKESAIAATLPPGLYTAVLAGLNGGQGVGLVEVYDRGP